MKQQLHKSHFFHQLAVNSLLELCTNTIDNQHIVRLEGRLTVTVDSGLIFELLINEDNIDENITSLVPDKDPGLPTSTFCSNDSQVSDETHQLEDATEALCSSMSSEPVSQLSSEVSDRSLLISDVCEGADRFQSMVVHSETDCTQPALTLNCQVMSKGSYYVCGICKKTLKSARVMSRHVRLKHGNGRLTFDKTGQVNETNTVGAKLLSATEQAMADGVDSLDCGSLETVNGDIKHGGAMSSGVDKMEIGQQDDGLGYHCTRCLLTFSSRSLQIAHQINFHRVHRCDRCGTMCTGRTKFVDHIRTTHPGVPMYKINKEYVCEYCSATCANEWRLNDHITSRHFGIKHQCSVCFKQLGTAETLRIHMREVHDPLHRHTCEACGRQFSRLAGLVEHLRMTHPNIIPERYRRKLGELVCNLCGLTFSRRETLRRHTETKHGGAPKYVCNVCGRKFQCQRYLSRHQKQHHKVLKNDNLQEDGECCISTDKKTTNNIKLEQLFVENEVL